MSHDTRIQQLRDCCAQSLPHPNPDELEQYCRDTRQYVFDDFINLPNQTLGRSASREELEDILREAAPETGTSFQEVMGEFESKVAANAYRPNHPRFFAFIPGAPNFATILGDWLCAGMNYFNGVWMEAAGPAQVELVVLDWFKSILGFPTDADGLLTGGGSEANLTALVAAREQLTIDERSRAVLYVTEQRHWSIDRAAKIIGMLPEQIHPLPADADFRLRADVLQKAVANDLRNGKRPWAVAANAGATNTGTVDPLAELADVCHSAGLWLHVDAAYGWSAALTGEGRRDLNGIERADSITLDPHKWFSQTFECGCLLVRENGKLLDTFCMRPDYLQDVTPRDGQVNFADYGIALTRRFRALKIWLSVKVLGLNWFRDLISHCCRLADYAEAVLRSSDRWEILCGRRLSIVCFRYLPSRSDELNIDEFNRRLAERLRNSGTAFISTTQLNGQTALRMCFVNWRTTADDVDATLDELLALAVNMDG